MSEILINNTRKKYIDAVKGFCIILVLFSHAGGIPYIGRFLFSCYMQAYFVTAGVTYRDRPDETLSQFALKKARRLLIPYAAYSTALWMIDCVFNRLTFSEILRGGVGVVYARHCLFPYQGDQENFFLLANLNGQLWFLPAIFLSYILFWFIVKADKKIRPMIAVGYIAVNIITSFLPILLPWSLDTVFITAVLMYFGFLMKPHLARIEHLDFRKMLSFKTFLTILFAAGLYLICCKVCGESNISVRIFGSREVISILFYMIIGWLGTILLFVCFAIAGNTFGLSKVCDILAYIGRRTLVLLATHKAIFDAIDAVTNLQADYGFVYTMIKVVTAAAVGLIMGALLLKYSRKNQWLKLLV